MNRSEDDEAEEAIGVVDAEEVVGESEPVDDKDESAQLDEPVDENSTVASDDDDGHKLEPLPDSELSLSIDPRSRTEVSGADQTSVLDSIIDE